MDLSIIISTWNNSARLAKTLEALSTCAAPPNLHWELIVVNNNCSDNTDAVVASFVTKLPIHYLFEPEQGTSRGKNVALTAATGTLSVLTDDDVTPGRQWINAYWAAFQARPQGFFFGGPVESEFEAQDVDRELLELAPHSVRGLSWGDEPRLLTESVPFLGANWACPTEILRQLGGFDPGLGLNPSSGQVRVGEESELMRRLRDCGWHAWYLPAARLKHFVPRNKSSLRHLGDRAEATGFYFASVGRQQLPQSRMFGTLPLLYCDALRRLLKWSWARSKGGKAYREYLQWRRHLGVIRGARELRR